MKKYFWDNGNLIRFIIFLFVVLFAASAVRVNPGFTKTLQATREDISLKKEVQRSFENGYVGRETRRGLFPFV